MNYTELLNPQNSALILIDFQPQMVFGVSNIDRQTLFNRVAGGFSPPAPTPPGMRVRTGRFDRITGP